MLLVTMREVVSTGAGVAAVGGKGLSLAKMGAIFTDSHLASVPVGACVTTAGTSFDLEKSQQKERPQMCVIFYFLL